MQQIDITVNDLVSALLEIAASEPVCILDSCGVRHLGSHLLIAGFNPVSVCEMAGEQIEKTLTTLDEALATKNLASIFTISYDFGERLLNIPPKSFDSKEPDVFLAQFDSLIVHDYNTGITNIVGNADRFDLIRSNLIANTGKFGFEVSAAETPVYSNFTRTEYLSAIEAIREQIRDGNTYQTNLTQQLSTQLPEDLTPQVIFHRLRLDHPAPFAAFITRPDSTVVSASPERFFYVDRKMRKISTSPIKGTRQRSASLDEDSALRQVLLNSEKDRAENTMIVDLLRNDLGRICEFGSVVVEKLCDLEEHPTLFHLVSTISGEVKRNTAFSDILKAMFPCGSITGAPKISTMRIIDEVETSPRGLSMGAIGYYVPSPEPNDKGKGILFDYGHGTLDGRFDLSVAIRTMVIRDQVATFNVGGGIVTDSDPESEYDETLTKALALLKAIGGQLVAEARSN